jgi:hypothetical protein
MAGQERRRSRRRATPEYYLFPVDFASCQTIQFLLRPVLLEEAGTQNDNTKA